MLYLYTDGSSTGKSEKPWGWAYLLTDNKDVLAWDYGGGPSGTNNTAELEAAVQGLLMVIKKFDCEKITLVSDSKYVLGLATGEYTPQKNKAKAFLLNDLFKRANAKARWVKGHGKDPDGWNNVVDGMAKRGKANYEKP